MSASSKVPLYLFQVLEEEYVALHDEQLASWNWKFDPAHIKNAAALISELDLTRVAPVPAPATEQSRAEQKQPPEVTSVGADPDQLAKNELRKYLRDKLKTQDESKNKELSTASSDAELVAAAP